MINLPSPFGAQSASYTVESAIAATGKIGADPAIPRPLRIKRAQLVGKALIDQADHWVTNMELQWGVSPPNLRPRFIKTIAGHVVDVIRDDRVHYSVKVESSDFTTYKSLLYGIPGLQRFLMEKFGIQLSPLDILAIRDLGEGPP